VGTTRSIADTLGLVTLTAGSFGLIRTGRSSPDLDVENGHRTCEHCSQALGPIVSGLRRAPQGTSGSTLAQMTLAMFGVVLVASTRSAESIGPDDTSGVGKR
jgi:hypothetical protein